MKNIEKTLQSIRSLEKEYASEKDLRENKVGHARYLQLVDVEKFLSNLRFPQSDEEKFKYSLVPLIFQEANYDNLDWTKLGSDLGQLQPFFNLDFLIQNDGKELSDSNKDEYHNYVQKSLAAIDYWKKKTSEKK